MITRKVVAESMVEALQAVMQELGPDALIVSVRQIPPPAWQIWRKATVEVVAVRMEEGEKKPAAAQPLPPSAKEAEEAPAAAAQPPRRRMLTARQRKNAYQPGGMPDETPAVPEKDPAAAQPAAAAEAPEAAPETPLTVKKITSPRFPMVDASRVNRVNPPAEKAEAPAKRSEANAARGEDGLPLLHMGMLTGNPYMDVSPALGRVFQQLRRQGVDEDLLTRMMTVSMETLGSRGVMDESRVRQSLQKQMEACLRVQKEPFGANAQVICLVGTSGAGKTSLCAKLAVLNQKTLGRKVHWVCADTVRTGAISEARAYAEAMGAVFSLVYTPEDLGRVMSEQADTDLMLVDTTPVNPLNEASVVAIGALLTALAGRSTWVVLPATGKETDLQNAMSAFSPFRPRGLAITKLDETSTFGSVFNLAWRSRLPLVFFSKGTQVLQDLESARAENLVTALFEGRWQS
ncbi:MAG TPA: hypothetical protein PKW33_14590 [Anaerolineaceae bacterium]|nr:hypothetical protein [Anaerolineaceae bacterium]HPN52818.1 hypothetical protein [Anaerolineaceae bacterium]